MSVETFNGNQVSFGMDPIVNGQGRGDVAELLTHHHFRGDTGFFRPFIDDDGQRKVRLRTKDRRVVQNSKGKQVVVPVYRDYRIRDLEARGIHNPVWNATSLRKFEWVQLDTVIQESYREPLRAFADLAAAASLSGFDPMSKSTFEYQVVNDPGSVTVSMDAIDESPSDIPLFKLRSLPLALIHGGFHFSQRQINVSNNGGQPFDTMMFGFIARRIGEKVEDLTIGTATGLAFGYESTGTFAHDSTYGSQIYGWTNYPSRNTYTSVTTPTGSNPSSTVSNVLAMVDSIKGDNIYGPFTCYFSNDWTQYLGNDYVTGTAAQGLAAPSETLMSRIGKVDQLTRVAILERWTPSSSYQILLLQMTADVMQAIDAMQPTLIQWQEKGGLQECFKVVACQLPLIRADYSDRCGIIHGTTS